MNQQPLAVGRELDAAIAAAFSPINLLPPFIPAYSTKIAAAWSVVEVMRERGWTISLEDWGREDPAWLCVFDHRDYGEFSNGGDDDNSLGEHRDTTAPEAICRAALVALEAQRESERG